MTGSVEGLAFHERGQLVGEGLNEGSNVRHGRGSYHCVIDIVVVFLLVVAVMALSGVFFRKPVTEDFQEEGWGGNTWAG